MTLRINSSNHISAFTQLQQSNKSLTESLERLSSGKRINRAADDASGMVIADALNSQSRGIGQGIRNATDAIALSQVADGAMEETVSLIQSIRVKALQAAQDGQSSESRQALQADIDKSLDSLNDIAANTTYNGQKLLSGLFSGSFQIGPSSNQTVEINIGSATPNFLASDEGTLISINVLSQEGAQQAIETTDAALADIDRIRSEIGSTQNQLESTISNLSATQVNLSAAQSGIADVDFAEEAMNLARISTLNKARMFALAQTGKINKEGMVNLLQG